MRTLKDITEPLVKEMAESGEQFSAHQVTQEVRKAVNAITGTGENLDIPIADFGSGHLYEISHTDVKQIVSQMYRDGDLDRTFNGSYFVYSGVEQDGADDDAPAIVYTIGIDPSTIGIDPSTNTSVSYSLVQATPTKKHVADLVYEYLTRNPGGRTMQQVVGTICRWRDYIPVKDIAAAIDGDKRFNIWGKYDVPSVWFIDVV